MKIIIVEDDPRVGDFLRRGLDAEGHSTELVCDGRQALAFIRHGEPDLVILDRMLPGIDGIQICTEIRSLGLPCRILMLSALAEVDDRVKGLRSGADDYLSKPFHLEELLARIDAVMQRDRQAQPRDTVLRYADLAMDLERYTVSRGERTLNFTAKELKILELLLRNPERVLSRERILNQVWGMNEDPLTNVVDVYMARLRKKIDTDGLTRLIHTRRGLGYVLSSSGS
ncbi:MAG: response regulator transcription factor [Wenzhouxiangella sp.]|nr:response regulator transcription factor [Wenzhouxiangella sp.]MCH8477592.1 response regulator transcription factor [Wenzhouxiangella sp.]